MRMVIQCHTCGQQLLKPPSLIRPHNFCNSECYRRFRLTLTGESAANWRGGITAISRAKRGRPVKYMTCWMCFSRYRGSAARKFCSRACSDVAKKTGQTPYVRKGRPSLRGESNPAYSTGIGVQRDLTCPNCAVTFRGNGRRIFCSRRCARAQRGREFFQSEQGESIKDQMSERLTGPRNWNWRGGRRSLPYAPGFVRRLKKRVRERDGNQCITCHVLPTRRDPLVVHHIDGSKDNHEESNLVTMCRRCHGKLHLGKLSLIHCAYAISILSPFAT